MNIDPGRTRRIGVATLISTVIVLSFAQFAGARVTTRHDSTVIRYAYFKIYDATFVGIEKGFFKQAGVDVALTGNFPNGPATIAASGTGQVDAGNAAIPGMALARNAGIDVHGVADAQTEFKDAPLERFYVRTDSAIHSIKDLKGKKIAVNGFAGTFYYTWLIALQRNGLSTSDVTFVNIPQPQQLQALDTGLVDVVGLIDPYNRQTELTPGHRLLFRGVDILGSRQISLIWFSDNFISSHRAAVREFVAAYRKSALWAEQNPGAAAEIEFKYLGVDPKYAIKHRYTAGTGIRMADVSWWLRVLRGTGDLKDNGKVTPFLLATTEFAGSAAKNAAGPRPR